MKLAWLRSLASTLFHRSGVEDEMEQELRAHIQDRVDDLERSGLGRAEAERQARIEFGGYQKFKEECRESLGVHLWETLVQDVRYGLRVLSRSPGFTAVAVLTLALGIGANAAIFSLIDAVMLRFLPVQKPQELVQLLRRSPAKERLDAASFTNPLWEEVRGRHDVFSGAFAWSPSSFDLAQGGEVDYVNGVFVSGEYFNTLGVRPVAGRLFTSSDDQRGCPALAVISYGFWQEHFGGAKNAVGSTLSVNNQPFQIIGVSAPGFYGVEVGSKFDVAVPVCSADVFDGNEPPLDQRSSWWLNIMGRVKPGISAEQLKARLEVLSPQIFTIAVAPNWGSKSLENFLHILLVPVAAATGISDVREQFGPSLTIVMAVVGLVLLIASANFAGLMFARASSRDKEVAIRKALGASRPRLIRQLLTEWLLLSLAGAALGLLFARWGAALLVRSISTAKGRISPDLSLDAPVLVFTAAIAVLTDHLVRSSSSRALDPGFAFISYESRPGGKDGGAYSRTSGKMDRCRSGCLLAGFGDCCWSIPSQSGQAYHPGYWLRPQQCSSGKCKSKESQHVERTADCHL